MGLRVGDIGAGDFALRIITRIHTYLPTYRPTYLTYLGDLSTYQSSGL